MSAVMDTTEVENTHIGSSLDDFLIEEDIYEESCAEAEKRVIAWQIEQAMKEKGITKSALAERMKTSRAVVDRLLDPHNKSLTLLTLQKAAAVVGKKLKIELV